MQGQKKQNRVALAAAEHGLAVTRRVEVIPRTGKPPLMHIYVLRWAEEGGGVAEEEFTVRLADGSLSADMIAARDAIGMPPVAAAKRAIEG